MRRAAQRWGRGLLLAAWLLPAARAQTVPAPAPAVASPRPDSVRRPTPTFVVDTTRQAVVVVAAEPREVMTRPLALRIGAAIAVITLTTLLLYNVRSR